MLLFWTMFSRMSEQQTVLDNRDSMSPSNPLHWEAEAVCFGVLRNKVYLCGTWDRHAYWLIFYILLKNFYFILEYSHPGGQQRYSAMHTCIRASSATLWCPTLCDSMDNSLPESSVLGIFQARILECLLFSPPGDLPDPGTEPASPESLAL